MTAVLTEPPSGAGSLRPAIESHISVKRKAKDKTATVLVTLCFGIALVPLVWLLWTVLSRGLHAILNIDWWTQSQRNMTFRTPGGGAYHAIVGTVIQVTVCAVISVP